MFFLPAGYKLRDPIERLAHLATEQIFIGMLQAIRAVAANPDPQRKPGFGRMAEIIG
jgi:hypothetical protein